jgi:large subunit ribosomal protein L15
MKLHNLTPAEGATKKRKRIGRGVGSGYGGHSSTKGNKGQKSRSGGGAPVWFEGGQMPLQRRLPKFGFKNPFRTEYRAVNLSRLASLISEGRIDGTQPITPAILAGVSVVRKGELVKVLGSGDAPSGITVHAHAFSASARQQIEAAGGTVSQLS